MARGGECRHEAMRSELDMRLNVCVVDVFRFFSFSFSFA